MTDLTRTTAASPAPRAPDGRRAGPTHPFVEFARAEIEQSIPARFEQQVRRYPDRLAVKAGARALTYAELNRAANRVARAILARRGVQREPVALLFEHGVGMLVAMLAVLKDGKFYVPLDPSYPYARLAHVLEDSGAGSIVTDEESLPLARSLAGNGREVLSVNSLDAQLTGEDLCLPVSPADVASIIYTSGSTGQPKGVIHSHRFILHHIASYTNSIHIAPDDRIVSLYPYSYIGGTRDIYGALLNGAALYPFDLKSGDMPRLAAWLGREEITICNVAATVFRPLADVLPGDGLPKLRLIRLGAEAIRARDVELYKQRLSSDCVLYVGLTITEAGGITEYFIDKETELTGSTAPVGYAVDGKEVLLLDELGEVVGPHRVGEIAVKSRYLADGYWRRPELTRAAFEPAPDGGGMQIYRTGDLGFVREDGCLECIGRKDAQVKVRGHRVEVAEVERALLDVPSVAEVVVVARADPRGEQELVAYLVSACEPAPTAGELLSWLRERMPAHMLPAMFVPLDALPLLPNGKVDRRALPVPERARAEGRAAYLAPRTPLEELLAGIWANLLEVERVGMHDDFLALGGNSMVAVQLVSRVRDALQLEVPLRALLEAPTVADQAEVIVQSWAARAEPDEVARLLDEPEGLSDDGAKSRLLEQAP